MNEVSRHYESLLAQHYSWMFGVPFESKVAEQQALLGRFGVGPGDRSSVDRVAAGQGAAGHVAEGPVAADLGCGPGYQSVALARLGFRRVLAIDSCQALLDELSSHAGALPIEAVCGDMLDLKQWVAPGSADAVVCMGDTLTHLQTRLDVSKLFAVAREVLAPGGMLVLTFRDLSVELKGLDRFLPIRSDADRIMTCVLEYEPDTVVVNDLVHVREQDGWALQKSSYRKLRLSVEDVLRELRQLGFTIKLSEPAGRLQAIAAIR